MRAAHNRYRRNLARERDAAAVYRALASRRAGEARASLLALARAEERHARHWASLLGEDAEDEPVRSGWRARLLAWLARRVSSLLVLSVVQRAELDGSYDADKEATAQMAADERVHARVVEGLARQRRARAQTSRWRWGTRSSAVRPCDASPIACIAQPLPLRTSLAITMACAG